MWTPTPMVAQTSSKATTQPTAMPTTVPVLRLPSASVSASWFRGAAVEFSCISSLASPTEISSLASPTEGTAFAGDGAGGEGDEGGVGDAGGKRWPGASGGTVGGDDAGG